jgi:hypothetical protein
MQLLIERSHHLTFFVFLPLFNNTPFLAGIDSTIGLRKQFQFFTKFSILKTSQNPISGVFGFSPASNETKTSNSGILGLPSRVIVYFFVM